MKNNVSRNTKGNKMFTVTQWKKEAQQAVEVIKNAKTTSNKKTEVYNRLAFGALQIFASLTIQDCEELQQAVAKGQPLHDLRGAVSKAKPLAKELKIHGFLRHKTKKAENTFQKEAILTAENPLFSVASLYQGLNALTESEAVIPTPKSYTTGDYIKAACEAEGLGVTIDEVMAMSENDIQNYVKAGQDILQTKENREKITVFDTFAKRIAADFQTLKTLDAEKAQAFIENLLTPAENLEKAA